MENSTSRNGSHSLLKALDQTPPFLVYYLTKVDKVKGSPHLGAEGFAARSGLSTSTIDRLSRRVTWAEVRPSVIQRFCDAAAVSLVKKGNRYYLVRPYAEWILRMGSVNCKRPLEHLSTRQLRKFNRLCEKWVSAQVDGGH